MRILKYREPYKITQSVLGQEYLSMPTEANYQRCVFIVSKYGIVIAEDMKWEHNHGIDCFTIFSTVIGGLKYCATIEEAKLTDRQYKWLSTRFIKQIADGSWRNFI